MAAKSFKYVWRFAGKPGSSSRSGVALSLTLALAALSQQSSALAATTPVQAATHATALAAPNKATPSNPNTGNPSKGSSVAAPNVPTPSSIITSNVSASLAKVLNAPQLVIDVGSLQNGTYKVTGNFVNAYNLVFVSSNSAVHTATLASTGAIYNPIGTSISTVIPSGYTNAVANLNLVLNAQTGIFNAGRIVSAGSLTMQAPVVANALPTAPAGSSNAGVPAPVMQSLAGNLNIQTSTLLNQGVISSAVGNINVTNLTNSLAINAVGGTFNAANGKGIINIGTQNLNEQLDLQLLGGDFVSQAVNFTAGTTGLVSMQINSSSGAVNVQAGDAYIGCNTGDLTLGNILVGGDPFTTDIDGNIIFTGITDVANISLVTPDSVLSQGASSILSQTGIIIEAGLNIDLTGVTSISSQSGNINLISDNGSISIPGVHITSNGGDIALVAHGDVNLDNPLSPAIVDSSVQGGGAGGHIFLASQNGNVDIGVGSQITTGALAPTLGVVQNGSGLQYAVSMGAFGGITTGNITAPGGSVVMASGVTTSGSINTGWTVHVFDAGPKGLSSGGISSGVVTTQLDGNGANSLLYINATNGSTSLNNVLANGGTVSVLATGDLSIQKGINNVSNSSAGGTVTAAANGNLQIGTGINNNATAGSGGIVSVSAGMPSGLNIGAGGITISDNAFTNGGSVAASNFGPLNYFQGGIQATVRGNGTGVTLETFAPQGSNTPSPITVTGSLAIGDASSNGNGGFVQISSNGDLNIQNAVISANGSGSGNGSSFFQLSAVGNINASGALLSANGGSNQGSGGSISASAGGFTGGGLFAINANGSTSGGTGGNVSFNLTNSGAFNSGDLAISARGVNGGSVSLSAGTDLFVNNSVFNVSPYGPGTGNGGSISLGANNGNLSFVGNLNADGVGSGNGGLVNLNSGGGNFTITGASQLSARGGANGGDGGTITLNCGGDMTLSADAVLDVSVHGNGSGGTINLSSGNLGAGSLTVNSNLSVNGAGGGNGGNISLQSQAGGNSQGSLTLNGNLSANAGSTGAFAGTIVIQMLSPSNLAGPALNLNGNIIADAANGTGGSVFVFSVGSGNAINVGSSAAVSMSAQGSNAGGTVFLNTFNASDININSGSTLLAGSSAGSGGQVCVISGNNINIPSATSVIDVSSGAASGGQITLSAGGAGTGILSLNGNVSANSVGAGNNASISMSQNSQTQAMQIGVSPGNGVAGSGIVSATDPSGVGGSLTISNATGDLNVVLNEAINLQGSNIANTGSLIANSSNNVSISGPGALIATLNGSGLSYTVSAAGSGSLLNVQQVASTGGNVTIKAGATNGAIVFQPGATVNAVTGSIEIGAPTITFAGSATISMDNAGVLKVDSGNQASSLALNFASGSVTFNVTQGGSQRPGTIAIGPTGNGSLNLTGSATLELTGGTVSMTSSSGSINLGANLEINSDAFDTSQNLGLEIVATNGNVNLNSTISARQLNVSTIGTGNINLGAEINSPTVVLSVQGNSSISQSASGSLGIGTLILQAGTGDIGSAASPLSANVLELQVTSGGSVYINNASSVDLKTSTVANTFQLNNEGDVAIENNLSAGVLNVTASGGSISIFNPVSGTNGVTLAATGAGNDVNISAGTQLGSSAGSITLNTDSLVLDGSIAAQGAAAQISVNSSAALNLSGTGGQISASGANSLISFNGSNSVTFAISYTLNAGASGQVQVQTNSLGGAGVILASGVALKASGGSQLNVFTNSITFNSGSSVSLSNSTNGMTVQSTAGAPLTVNVVGATIPITSTGGSAQFVAGTGGTLLFTNPGAGTNSLAVNGGSLVTSSSAADTTLNNVNLSSSGNIQITVSGANLNLNGNNVTSSQSGGVIVLQDPDGITINGGGTIGFSGGASGSIALNASSPAAALQINGSTVFNAGSVGSVSFAAAGSVTFASGSSSTVNGGSQININSPQVNFGSNSQLLATGASSVNVTSPGALSVSTAGTATISTNGGSAITFSAPAGNGITFLQSGTGGTTLNLNGAPTVITTSNANVTINSGVVLKSNNNVSVLTPGGTLINNGLIDDPGAGSTTIIQAAGNLVINQNVSANNLIIETTAHNGNITLSANVNVVNALTVSAIGGGNITQTTGLLTAASISLISQSGNIGSDGKAIKVSTADLSVSTSGNAWVKALGPVRVDSFSVGGDGLHLTANGNISIGAANAQTVNLTSTGTFNAGPQGTVSINASNTISLAPGVRVRVDSSSLSVSAPNISMGDESRLRAVGNVTVTGNISSSGDFRIVSREGNLQISGSLSGHNVRLVTKDNGNITLSGNMNANKLNVLADGSGNISQLSGLLSAVNLNLSSDSGNIGTVGSAISVSGTNLSVQTGGKGVVNIGATGDLTVDNSSSGGNFTVSASGALTIGEICTNKGSITLSSTGAMQLEKNSSLVANQGNLTIRNTDSVNGTITIGKNSSLEALSNTANNGLGNVYIVIGNIPTNPVKGSAPANTSVSQLWGGTAYFGTKGITAQGKSNQNQIEAWGANVVFSTGTSASSAISLQGGVFILADPPPAPTVALSGFASSLFAIPASSASIVHAASATIPGVMAQGSNNPLMIIPAAQAPTYVLLPSLVMHNNGVGHGDRAWYKDSAVQTGEVQNNGDELQPIACVSALTDVAVQHGTASIVRAVERSSDLTVYRSAASFERKSSSLAFKKGEILVNSHNATEVTLERAHISLAEGACAVIRSDGKTVEVFNLYEKHLGAIKVTVDGHQFILNAGQSLVAGQGSAVAMRNEKAHKVAGGSVKVAEFPFMSLLNSSNVLPNLMRSRLKEDRQLGAKLFKMAACLTVVTSAHGAFHSN